MALSKATKQFSDDDLITCGICHTEMEHPRSLFCLHTYCLGCLREWSKHSKNKVICPLCREATPLPPDGVDGLRSNFFVTKLKDRKAVSRQLIDKDVKIACTSCDVSDGNEVVGRCLDCDDFLCEICFKAHKAMRLMKHHTTLTLTELRSGKIAFTQQKFKEDYCTDHKGQVFWFFCKTCNVPICRDCTVVEHPTGTHDVVKLDSVVTSQKKDIDKLVSKCRDVKKKVDGNLALAHSMHGDLDVTCDKIIKQVMETTQKVKEAFLAILKKQEENLKESIAKIKQTRQKALTVYEEELRSLQCRFSTAVEMGSQVSTEGSNCDVASAYKPLMTTLKQLGQTKSISIDLGKISFVEESSLTSSNILIGKIEAGTIQQKARGKSVQMRNKEKWNATWKIVRTFGDTGEGKLKNAKGVAVNQDGDVAVADFDASKVYVYDIENGNLKTSINTKQSLQSNPSRLSRPWDVVAYQGDYIVSDKTNFPTVYDNKGKFIRRIVTGNEDDCTMGIAVNSQGHVLVGHEKVTSLRIYSYIDSKQIATLNIPIPAWYIAVSQSDNKIFISANDSAGAQVVDSKGRTIHKLRPPSDVTLCWSPSGVCTIGEGDEEEIFFCNGDYRLGVYRFSLTTGKYLGCVTTEVKCPQGIAFTEDGRLVVADKTCVKVFAPDE